MGIRIVGAAEKSILSMLGTTREESNLSLSEKHATYFCNNYIDESIWGFQAGEGAHYFDDTPNTPYEEVSHP